MATFTNVTNRYTGRTYKNRLNVSVIGGPELARKLRDLDEDVRVKVAKDAIMAAGEPLQQLWVSRLPVGPEPYHVKDAITVKASKTKRGASGSVGVRKVRGADADEQPTQYARKLEYGGRFTAAQPAARPAFDQGQRAATAAAVKVLRTGVMRAAR